jgi:hypothetical protein
MGGLVSWLVGAAGLFLGWLLCQLVIDLVGEAMWEVTGPFRRPIWRVFVAASWPWPLFLLLGIGGAAFIAGLVVLSDLSQEHPLGLWLVLGGAAIMLVSPFLWRDARRERVGRGWR